jgi:L-rhamnose isomerase
VWDFYCLKNGVPVGASWLDAVREYEQKVLAQRK